MAQDIEDMDAVALLKADHRKVEEIFAAFEKARSDDRKRERAFSKAAKISSTFRWSALSSATASMSSMA